MFVRKWTAAAAGVGLALFGLSACGEEDTGSDAPEVATFEGDPIVIGTICSCSSNQSAVLKDSTQGVSAWADHVNKNGGLNGHPVKLIVKDDAGDPAKGLQAAKELVDEGAIAIVGMTSTTDPAWQSYVEEQKIPVVGGMASEATFITSPDFFPSGANSVLQTFGALQEAKKAGLKKFGILYCAETPVCAEVDGIGKAFSAQLGIGFTSTKISASAPDYNAPCLALKDQGVDALFIAHNASVVNRVAESCAQNGFKPQKVSLMNGLDQTTIESPNFEGTLLSGSLAMHTDESVAGVKEYRDAVEEYNPGFTDSAGFNAITQFSWSGGKLFEAAAIQAKLGPDSTSADVFKGLYALKGETLGGMAPPLTFAKGKPAFPPCYFIGTITGGELKAPQSEPVCLDEAQMGQMAELLKALA